MSHRLSVLAAPCCLYILPADTEGVTQGALTGPALYSKALWGVRVSSPSLGHFTLDGASLGDAERDRTFLTLFPSSQSRWSLEASGQ